MCRREDQLFEPTVAELSAAAGVSEEAVLEALGALTANDWISLETPRDNGERTLSEEIGCDLDQMAVSRLLRSTLPRLCQLAERRTA